MSAVTGEGGEFKANIQPQRQDLPGWVRYECGVWYILMANCNQMSRLEK